MAALLLWESGKGGECSWSCCEGIRGRIWASSDVPQNAIDTLLDYFHDGPSQRASLGAASRFETLWLLWVWIHKRNNLLGEYEFSNKTICSMNLHAIQSRTWTLQLQVIMCVHIFSCLEWRGHVKECGEVCGWQTIWHCLDNLSYINASKSLDQTGMACLWRYSLPCHVGW